MYPGAFLFLFATLAIAASIPPVSVNKRYLETRYRQPVKPQQGHKDGPVSACPVDTEDCHTTWTAKDLTVGAPGSASTTANVICKFNNTVENRIYYKTDDHFGNDYGQPEGYYLRKEDIVHADDPKKGFEDAPECLVGLKRYNYGETKDSTSNDFKADFVSCDLEIKYPGQPIDMPLTHEVPDGPTGFEVLSPGSERCDYPYNNFYGETMEEMVDYTSFCSPSQGEDGPRSGPNIVPENGFPSFKSSNPTTHWLCW